MRCTPLLSLAFAPAIILGASQESPSYKGTMRTPADLRTGGGTELPAGHYELEVKGQAPGRQLIFSLKGETKAKVAELVEQDPALETAEIPLVGTHLLRSTAVKLAPAKERQFSQSGMPRYQEERHLWNGTMRVYLSQKEGMVFFIFQERGKGERWSRSNFRLRLLSAP